MTGFQRRPPRLGLSPVSGVAPAVREPGHYRPPAAHAGLRAPRPELGRERPQLFLGCCVRPTEAAASFLPPPASRHLLGVRPPNPPCIAPAWRTLPPALADSFLLLPRSLLFLGRQLWRPSLDCMAVPVLGTPPGLLFPTCFSCLSLLVHPFPGLLLNPPALASWGSSSLGPQAQPHY